MMTPMQLARNNAPFDQSVWAMIEDEIKRVATGCLSARQLLGITGPLGTDAAAINNGRTGASGAAHGVRWRCRTSQPLVEIEVDFQIAREEIEAAVRGAGDPDWEPVEQATYACNAFEEGLIYNGLNDDDGSVLCPGIQPSSEHAAIKAANDPESLLGAVAEAKVQLKRAGMAGPRALVFGAKAQGCLAGVHAPSGRPMGDVIADVLGGEIRWSPAVDSALVIAVGEQGEHFEPIIGNDLVVGYRGHDEQNVTLFLSESLTFLCHEPRAAVAISM